MQGYLENSPLIVLGSGASMPYGLPSMWNLAKKIESGEFELGEINFGKMKGKMPTKKAFNGEKSELTEELKVAIAEKIASGEFKQMAKAGKGMKNFAKKASKLNTDTTEVVE